MSKNKGHSTQQYVPIEEKLQGPHSFSLGRYSSCQKCGHVPLNNDISRLINSLGCGYGAHPSYKKWVDNGRRF